MNFDILETIEKIYSRSKDSQLKSELFENLKSELEKFSDYLRVDQLSALLFANAFTIGHRENSFHEIFKYFGMNEFLEVLKHQANIELLYKKSLLKNKRARQCQFNTFEVPQGIIDKISKGEPIPVTASENIPPKGFVDVLQEFDELSDQFDDEKINLMEFRYEMRSLIENNLHFPFFTKMKNWNLNDFETFFLLDTIWDAVDHGNNNFNTNVSRTVGGFYKSKSNELEVVTSIVSGETRLTTQRLIDLEKSKYKNRVNAKLSKYVLKTLRETQKIKLDIIEEENTSLLLHSKIKRKELFYSKNESIQIETINNILDETKFRSVKKMMAQKAMPAGITILLHGEPGTGKTETIYQLAKASGRNIFKVDISQTKTMWFGESEKLVKKIFTDYKDLKKDEKRCPILLFNEADAVIGKRRTTGSSSVSNTENAMQNILLEEIENFEGILCATTNLIENMDAAFERRFLYKVKFEKPLLQNSAKIWLSKLPFLKESESLLLAETFSFSGGEMENIARKSTLHEILTGDIPDFELVNKFCSEEKWAKSFSKIGFSK